MFESWRAALREVEKSIRRFIDWGKATIGQGNDRVRLTIRQG
jgi:hypothetical protein